MYEHAESAVYAGCFDPNDHGLPTTQAAAAAAGSGVAGDSPFTSSSFLIDEAKDYHHQQQQQHQQDHQDAGPVLDHHHQVMAQQIQDHHTAMAFNSMSMEHCFNTDSMVESHNLVEDSHHNASFDQLGSFQNHDQAVVLDQNFNLHTAAETGTSPATDLLNLLHLPRLPNPSISFANPIQKPSDHFSSSLGFLGVDLSSTTGDSIPHDPLLHLNLPPTQPPLFRDLMFSASHHVYGLRGSSLFGGPGLGIDDGEGSGGICQEGHPLGDGSGGVFEFGRDNHDMGACVGKAAKDPKCPKNFVTERQRRVNLNDKYQQLKGLVPSPTKGDRASIVGDTIEYIKELNRTVNELKHLVEKKRSARERMKRHKASEDDNGTVGGGGNGGGSSGDVENPRGGGVLVKSEQSFNSSTSALRSSWLQRKCKDTEVDVRIIDDEVTIKLIQRKKISCLLLYVSRTLDELQLDLRHVAGGHCGDYFSFLFSTKIYEGSSVYASAIANRLIEVVDRQYAAAAISPTATY